MALEWDAEHNTLDENYILIWDKFSRHQLGDNQRGGHANGSSPKPSPFRDIHLATFPALKIATRLERN